MELNVPDVGWILACLDVVIVGILIKCQWGCWSLWRYLRQIDGG